MYLIYLIDLLLTILPLDSAGASTGNVLISFTHLYTHFVVIRLTRWRDCNLILSYRNVYIILPVRNIISGLESN